MAKANALTGASHYVAEGQPVPDDLPAEVRLVGPGAPADDDAPQGEAVYAHASVAAVAAAQPPAPAADDSDGQPADDGSEAHSAADDGDDEEGDDYADYPIRYLRELCRDRDLSPTGAKAELVTRLEEHDRVLAATG